MSFEYQDRVTAFIDLLGFKEMIRHSESDKNRLDAIYESLTYLKSWELPEKWGLENIEIEESAQKKGLDNFEISEEVSCTCFSDSIVVSIPAEESNVNYVVSTMISHLAAIGAKLMASGVLFRGGISYGKLAHQNDGIVVGPALVSAYETESKLAKYPRIVLSKKLIEKLNYPILKKSNSFPYHQYLSRHEDGCVGFTQLTFFQVMQSCSDINLEKFSLALDQSKSAIIEGLNSTVDSPDVYRKYAWLKAQYDELIILEEGLKNSIRPISTQDIYFQ